MEIMVYFNSSNKMKLNTEKVRFMTARDIGDNPALIERILEFGKIPVIIDNVSFVRVYEPPKEEDD